MPTPNKPKHGRAKAVEEFIAAANRLRQEQHNKAVAMELAILQAAEAHAAQTTGYDAIERQFFGIKVHRTAQRKFAIEDPNERA